MTEVEALMEIAAHLDDIAYILRWVVFGIIVGWFF